MHDAWHNCGQILDRLPDTIEIGVDVVQLDQLRPMGLRRPADEFGGRICFWSRVDFQGSAQPRLTHEWLRAEVREMGRAFDRFGGGSLARRYPQPAGIELSSQPHEVIYRAFLDMGCTLP